MIRRSPAEYYIRYLLLHPNDYSDEDVERALIQYHLDYPGGDYLTRLRQQMERPNPFFPYDTQHFASYKFLCRHKVVHAFHQDVNMLEAIKILERPRAKELVETMLITQDVPAYITHRLQAIGTSVQPKSITRYAHFFWNLQLVDATELKALLEMRFKQSTFEGDGAKSTALGLALKKAGFTDPRWLAANAPDTHTAAMLSHIRNGYMPTNFDVSRLITTTAILAILRVRHESISNHQDSAQKARDFTAVAQGMTALLEMMGSPGEELLKSITSMGVELQHASLSVPTINQLTEGNFSADMQAMPEETADEREDSTGLQR